MSTITIPDYITIPEPDMGLTIPEWSNERNQMQARIIKDSISPAGIRLTTYEVTFWRMMLAEFNTHRVFSRNSESSRAVPFLKRLARVLTDPYIPLFTMEQSGMQGDDEITPATINRATNIWLNARTDAVNHAEALAELGIHKSIVNRLIEPWLYHTVVVTSTEWGGFWAQRDNLLAQHDIRVPAAIMHRLYDESTPTEVDYGEWHLPFITEADTPDDFSRARHHAKKVHGSGLLTHNRDVAVAVSSARCARTSYLTHDGVRDMTKDVDLYFRLIRAKGWPHASPLEHPSTPCRFRSTSEGTEGCRPGRHRGNHRGWDQHRHLALNL